MCREPLASGVLIFYQAERFIEEAIRSVFSQSVDWWELLLIDDGSTDGSTAIAQKYARSHPERVRYFHHKGHANCGKSTSRNLGLEHARGKYVAFLDADDVWLPDKLAEQAPVLDRYSDAVMMYGPTQCWYAWPGSMSGRADNTTSVGVQADRLYDGNELLTRFVTRGGMVPGICSLLVRRDAAMCVGGFEETIQHMFEDQTLLAKLCLSGPVFVSSGCHDRYRQHGASTSAQAIKSGSYHPWKPNPARLRFLRWLNEYAVQHPNATKSLRGALKRELWREEHPRWGILARTPRVLMEVAARRMAGLGTSL
jgi:glycosyltransferase involved in cell wall biosynthesis